MAKQSKIEWTHHTFNPWWGCTKVSSACKHCYAETWAKRVGHNLWGRGNPRRFFSDTHWQGPLKWNAEAASEGERKRVFCASMADVFESRKELNPWRRRLWNLIEDTPWLDWLLLTKRPQMIGQYIPWKAMWPDNVWLGVTVENQKLAEKRIPMLLSYPAKIRFLSCEPLLGSLVLDMDCCSNIDWVIAGGESGHNARPTQPVWVRALRDQCNAANIPFHFKQWGHWAPELPKAKTSNIKIIKRGDITLFGLGKSAAGRYLDGQTWDQYPAG